MSNIRTAEFTVNAEQLTKLCIQIDNDLEAFGWDRPHRLYAIVGKPDDPRLDLMFDDLPQGHPHEVLNAFVDQGMRIVPQVHGLALVTEAWRHLGFSEMEARFPDVATEMRKGLKQFWPEATDEEVETTCRNAYYKAIDQFAPSAVDDDHRIECRMVHVVLRNGAYGITSRDRGASDAHIGGMGSTEAQVGGRVADALHNLLTASGPWTN